MAKPNRPFRDAHYDLLLDRALRFRAMGREGRAKSVEWQVRKSALRHSPFMDYLKRSGVAKESAQVSGGNGR